MTQTKKIRQKLKNTKKVSRARGACARFVLNDGIVSWFGFGAKATVDDRTLEAAPTPKTDEDFDGPHALQYLRFKYSMC
jgi:hypothetical protein